MLVHKCYVVQLTNHILFTLIVYKLFQYSYIQYYLTLYSTFIHFHIMLNNIMHFFPYYPCLSTASGLPFNIYMVFFHIICCTQFITCTLHIPSNILTTNRSFLEHANSFASKLLNCHAISLCLSNRVIYPNG